MLHCEEAGPGIFVRTIEVQWHYAAPSDTDADKLGMQGRIEGITCIDYHPIENRFLTTGGDSNIIIWQANLESMEAWLKNAAASEMSNCCRWIATLACNDMPRCARWSPQGRMIASAHSDPRIRLWWKTADVESSEAQKTANGASEIWKDLRLLSGHLHEVMDLAFSPDSRHIISAGMHGTVLVHDIESISPVVSLEAHTKFCYGVAWDPWNMYAASFGSGPALITHSVVPRTESRRLQLTGQRKSQASYHGEGYSSTMRRLDWSPDGSLLATPFGKQGASEFTADGPEWKNRVYLYLRGMFEQPVASITVHSSNEIRGVLWAPCFLESSEDTADVEERWSCPQYRMALAAWTEDTVYVYSTNQQGRHSDFTDLHMLGIADLTWSRDARFIFTCSFDGYVTALFFDRPLGKAFVLPTFSDSKLCQSMCSIGATLSASSEQYEAQRTKINTGTPAAVAVHTAVKKKKRRTEDSPTKQETPQTIEKQDIALDELLACVDNEE
ncbi:chromatin assembly factor 1 subunit B, putative [Bodo saltans]|uniref:Chromatin assembly factor 1 subunit B, putative n=1 Tax=Bodo saltans TaxID=75058 RepID=A0A0S4JTR4_BODSA|nr:chromatin assembly factor 1 subunit B, putative [Bodo saltans]|eukprot:CUG93401.1 chromatin assembly factor 1 subunit B, putative [Bodo saltans]